MLSRVGTGFGKISLLDLRGSGLSVIERLCLEECLFQKEIERNWLIVGCHEPVHHRFMKNSHTTNNDGAVIVMGIGGKPEKLLNLDLVRQDQVLTVKRFSGGGTVVLDYDSIWVTIIGRRQDFLEEHFPRPIMDWTAEAIYEPMFERLAKLNKEGHNGIGNSIHARRTMVLDTKSCGTENTGHLIQVLGQGESALGFSNEDFGFRLRENDYVLGDKKIGGNAQSIGKTGWLHHTSFLWDYQQENMEFLTLPSKRPDYRASRQHKDFLVKLREAYPNLTKTDFFATLKDTANAQFDVQPVTVKEGLSILNENGGFTKWFQNQTRIKILESV